jgi:hypothetical protein
VEIGLVRAGDCNNTNNVNAVDFNLLREPSANRAQQPTALDGASLLIYIVTLPSHHPLSGWCDGNNLYT